MQFVSLEFDRVSRRRNRLPHHTKRMLTNLNLHSTCIVVAENMNLIKATLLLVLGCLSTADAADDGGFLSRTPCHPNFSVKAEPGELGCDQISLPPGFCSSCPIGDFDELGQFYNCWETMKVDEPQCIAAMQEYVDLNPCDQTRANSLNDMLTGTGEIAQLGRLRMDWFMFSICGQGCDCIPTVNAERETPAFDFARGNCKCRCFWFF